MITWRADIFIAGDIDQAKQVCREYCREVGFCVTVSPTTFIYSYGEEAGVRIGLIHYPRFPMPIDQLWSRAIDLGNRLRDRLCQRSFSIVADDRTEWFSLEVSAP